MDHIIDREGAPCPKCKTGSLTLRRMHWTLLWGCTNYSTWKKGNGCEYIEYYAYAKCPDPECSGYLHRVHKFSKFYTFACSRCKLRFEELPIAKKCTICGHPWLERRGEKQQCPDCGTAWGAGD